MCLFRAWEWGLCDVCRGELKIGMGVGEGGVFVWLLPPVWQGLDVAFPKVGIIFWLMFILFRLWRWMGAASTVRTA